MSGIEIVALISSIASLILAIGAIWLSIVFFKMSNEASQATTEAAKGIDSSIQRLEDLFDKLYSDTFSMMKDTVSDMRKHIWSSDNNTEKEETSIKNDIIVEAEKKAEEKFIEIKSTIDKQLSEILSKQKTSDGKVKDISSEIDKLLNSAIQTSRFVETEAREETVRNHILIELRKGRRRKGFLTAKELADNLSHEIPLRRIIIEIKLMKHEGIVIYEDDGDVKPDTRIRLPRVFHKKS